MLNANDVDTLFRECLFTDDEDTTNAIRAEGLIHPVGFNPDRINKNKQQIREMLLQLPTQFMKSGGGGWSFLMACNDKDDNQWADFHISMEQLFQLGEAIGIVTSPLPREMWAVLPGGMPYYIVDDIKEI